MATLPQIVDVLAKHDGRDHATLTQFGRVIRDAGLVPGGKRGRGAPHLSAESLVKLLLGTYGSFAPKDAPETIARLSSLRCTWGPSSEMPEVIQRIERTDTFFDAMVETLTGAPGIRDFIANVIREAHTEAPGDEAQAALLKLALWGMGSANFRVMLRGTSAEMSITSHDRQTLWQRPFLVDATLFMQGFYGQVADLDRQVIVTFGMPVLLDLSACLSSSPEDAP